MLNKKALAASLSAKETDADFKQTVLLLHGDGTNGAQNNTFTDSSTNAFTITRNGNTTQGTFSPFSQTGWSNYFTAASSGLYNASGSNTAIHPAASFLSAASGSRVGSIEALVYVTAYPSSPASGEFAAILNFGGNYFNFGVNSSGELSLYYYSGSASYTESTAASKVPLNQWVYVAAIFDSSNNVKLYVNGTEEKTATFNGVGYASGNNTMNQLRVGRTYSAGTSVLQGYISNLRIVDGTAVTPTTPTTPLTAITNTKLLTCQSNRFVDNSASPYTLTIEGTPSVQAFSPFAPTDAYSASTNGGSGYFDGSGDYLSVAGATALNYGSGDFTIECWYYPTSSSSGNISTQGDGNLPGSTYEIKFGSSGLLTINFYSTSGAIPVTFDTTKSWVLNAWNHVAVVRNGNTITCYMDGVSAGSGTATGYSFGTTDTVYIGTGLAGSGVFKGGYISNFRIVKGTAVYTAAFTPPTSPLTAISGTSLLCNFTNAGIIDQTGKNNLETVGNAQIDTGTKKFGTGSLEFDGTGDYILLPKNPLYEIGSGDFTMEAWIYPTANGSLYNSGIFSYGAASTLNGYVFAITGSNAGGTLNRVMFEYNYDGTLYTSTTGISLNTWTHVAVTRSGSNIYVFVNGTLESTTSTTKTANTNASDKAIVGSESYDPASADRNFEGFIDDLRITKGKARYTANFTAPTKAFADQ